MRNLKPISGRPLKIYDAIVMRKGLARRALLMNLRPTIKRAYTTYYRRRRTLETMIALGNQLAVSERLALRHCYDGATDSARSASPRDHLYARIRALTDECGYCGACTAFTLDHYLPKEDFPEFCVYPYNLVPACSSCNTPRPILAPTGERALIHPYFDDIPQVEILRASISVAHTPQARYKRHFELLGLASLYAKRSQFTVLPQIRETIRTWGTSMTRTEIKATLLDHAAKSAQRLGQNDFRVALHRASAASNSFLDFCGST
jgi:5-methylcytosine-specific restriction endonuclease McrA